jgi:hypothetical protein
MHRTSAGGAGTVPLALHAPRIGVNRRAAVGYVPQSARSIAATLASIFTARPPSLGSQR